ncbi:phosphonate C-P lyase system protein PhnG [Rhizobium sp.]
MKRAERISALALATPSDIEEIWKDFGKEPAFVWVTKPEFAATMVRGRIAGDGPPFNLGEVGITRCVVQLEGTSLIGAGYVVGRAKRRATLVALLDALTQQQGDDAARLQRAIAALPEKLEARRRQKQKDIASSRVDFSIASAGVTE